MSATRSNLDVHTRPFRDEDEARVVDLLQITMGDGPAGRRTPEFFRWKHLENPFGRSMMWVAECDGSVVGLRAFMQWRFRAKDREVGAVQAVDTATHPDYQGMGIFSRLTRTALETLPDQTSLIYNTPNEKSMPGYLKMGWRTVGRFPVSIRIRRPLRFATRLRGTKRLQASGEDSPRVHSESASTALRTEDLMELVTGAEVPNGRLSTPRSLDYLRWRYGRPPGLDYRVVHDDGGGRAGGVAIFRVRPRGRLWEAAVVELLVPRNDVRTAISLLRRVAHASPVDYLTGHFTDGSTSARAAVRAGFLRSPARITVVVNPLRPDVEPDPLSMPSWSFSLGDLEIF
jgi:GNAT superfamily N-acetyltransferase